jgi:hypothetical protein
LLVPAIATAISTIPHASSFFSSLSGLVWVSGLARHIILLGSTWPNRGNRNEALKVIVDAEVGGGDEWIKVWALAKPGNVELFALCVREGSKGLPKGTGGIEGIKRVCVKSEFASGVIEAMCMHMDR